MTETRSRERLKFHYRIERELADRLKAAPAQERLRLYGPLYDELFRRVSDHPQLTQHADPVLRRRAVQEQLINLRPWLRPGSTFLELGAGDCALSAGAAASVGTAWALDVSEVITGVATLPTNLRRLLSDGIRIDLPEESVDLAYSHQLIEHLHPGDALAQLREVRRVLKPQGVYVCVTPNRLTGPHDVSGYFDDVATGFHLREYTVKELKALLEEAGFACRTVVTQIKGRRVELPISAALALEASLAVLPRRLARKTARHRPVRWVLNTVQIAASRS